MRSWISRVAILLIAGLTIVLSHSAIDRAANNTLPWPLANQIVAGVKTPVFPDKTFSVLTYGAVANGKIDDTDAFAKTIAACNAAGGGHVIVPVGNYLTGAIILKSNVDLHLENGAVIIFSGDEHEFPLEPTRYQGVDLMNFSPLIYAPNASNIAITGGGVLDGTLTARWNRNGRGAWELLQNLEKNHTPIAQRIFGPVHPLRTVLLEPYNSSNVLIQGIIIRNSTFWQIHPLLCTNVIVDHVTTNSTTANTDGCDPESSNNVVIEYCNLGAGDDDIAIKSGRNPDTQRVHRPSENIVIMNTTCNGTWGMITCGSEQSDGIEHVFGYNLKTPEGNDRLGVRYLLYIKSNSYRGGYVKDINLENVTGVFIGGIVHVSLTYGGETGSTPPIVENIHLSHITDIRAPYVLNVEGLPDNPIEAFTMTDCTFTNIADIANVVQGAHMTISNVTINGLTMPSQN
jgi:polygalacturonase